MDRKNFIFKASVGFSLGVLIDIGMIVLMSVLSSEGGELYVNDSGLARWFGNPNIAIALDMFLSGLVGAVANGSVAFTYDNDSWSLLKATLVHFFITMVTFVSIGSILGWLSFEQRFLETVITLSCYIAAYIIIWIVQSTLYKKTVRELNQEVHRLKGHRRLDEDYE